MMNHGTKQISIETLVRQIDKVWKNYRKQIPKWLEVRRPGPDHLAHIEEVNNQWAPVFREEVDAVEALWRKDPEALFVAYDKQKPDCAIGYLHVLGFPATEQFIEKVILGDSAGARFHEPSNEELLQYVIPRKNWAGVIDLFVHGLIVHKDYNLDPVAMALIGEAKDDFTRFQNLKIRRIGTIAVENDENDDWKPDNANKPRETGCPGANLALRFGMGYQTGCWTQIFDPNTDQSYKSALYISPYPKPLLARVRITLGEVQRAVVVRGIVATFEKTIPYLGAWSEKIAAFFGLS